MRINSGTDPYVVGVTATFRRPAELKRLLASLPRAGSAMRRIVVVDNANDPATKEVVDQSPIEVEYITPEKNLGCGGGLRAAEQVAVEKFGDQMTHLWILDDDTVVVEGALDILLKTLSKENADAAHPLVIDAEGRLGWYPGLTDPDKFRVIRQPQTPEDFVKRCGDDPVPFSWAQGIALLVSRRALDQLGFHRADYWVRGEDLEFSLRITHKFRGIYVPEARVEHLPPPATSEPSPKAEYAKHCAMLQNIAYTSLRLAHGRPIVRTIPGNWVRFIRTWGKRPSVLADAARMFWRGTIRGWPAGHQKSRFVS